MLIRIAAPQPQLEYLGIVIPIGADGRRRSPSAEWRDLVFFLKS